MRQRETERFLGVLLDSRPLLPKSAVWVSELRPQGVKIFDVLRAGLKVCLGEFGSAVRHRGGGHRGSLDTGFRSPGLRP